MGKGKRHLPGSLAEIIRRGRCLACGHEADYQLSEDAFSVASCEACGSVALEELYIVFPEDGPGFDDGYAKLNLP